MKAGEKKWVTTRITKVRNGYFSCATNVYGAWRLDKSHVESIIGKEDKCPLCNQDQLSSFPITINDTFSYQYSEKTGVDVKFAVQKNDQLIQRNKGKYPIQFLDFGVWSDRIGLSGIKYVVLLLLWRSNGPDNQRLKIMVVNDEEDILKPSIKFVVTK